MSEREEIRVADVIVKDRLRQATDEGVDEAVDSIKRVGLLHPIVVTRTPEGLVLVAGLHRLLAFKKLGRETIPATVARVNPLVARMAEIDENLCRTLSALDRSVLTAERQRLYEQEHPETRHVTERGGPGRGKKTGAESAPVRQPSFTQDTSQRTGRSQRAVQQDARIAKRLAPDVQEAIKGTPLAHKKTELLELASLEPDEQRAVVERIRAGDTRKVLTIARQPVPEQPATEVDLDPEIAAACRVFRSGYEPAMRITGANPRKLWPGFDADDREHADALIEQLRGWLDILKAERPRETYRIEVPAAPPDDEDDDPDRAIPGAFR